MDHGRCHTRCKVLCVTGVVYRIRLSEEEPNSCCSGVLRKLAQLAVFAFGSLLTLHFDRCRSRRTEAGDRRGAALVVEQALVGGLGSGSGASLGCSRSPSISLPFADRVEMLVPDHLSWLEKASGPFAKNRLALNRFAEVTASGDAFQRRSGISSSAAFHFV